MINWMEQNKLTKTKALKKRRKWIDDKILNENCYTII